MLKKTSAVRDKILHLVRRIVGTQMIADMLRDRGRPDDADHRGPRGPHRDLRRPGRALPDRRLHALASPRGPRRHQPDLGERGRDRGVRGRAARSQTPHPACAGLIRRLRVGASSAERRLSVERGTSVVFKFFLQENKIELEIKPRASARMVIITGLTIRESRIKYSNNTGNHSICGNID